MKLQHIAAAAMLAATGMASAAPIDRGINSAITVGGDFFFNIFDTAGSYTTNLNIRQFEFIAGVAAPGNYSFLRDLNADSLFRSFISTANLAELQWNVLAVESIGNRTLHQTYSSELPATGQTATNGRSMVLAVQNFIGRVNDGMAPGGNSAVFDNTQAGYAGNLGCNNTAATQQFNNCGTLANNSYSTGLGLAVENYAGTGTARGTIVPVVDNNLPVNVWLDANYNLNMVAEVPEPETYAMLLAGLGLMGAVARRRQNKADKSNKA